MKRGEDESQVMRLAINEAKRSQHEDDNCPHPFVGAVIVHGGQILASACRGDQAPGDHAEYTALEKKLKSTTVAGATVYTTLEPCTTRNHPKVPCADRLVERKVSRVVIGMLDPDQRITGQGVLRLRRAGIAVDFFPPNMMAELEELNRSFIREKEGADKAKASILSAGADLGAALTHAATGLGLTAMYNMRDARGQDQRNEQTRVTISRAADMCLAANSGASYLDAGVNRHWDEIKRRLKAGVRFRVVLLDPASSERQLRNRLNGSPEDSDAKINVANLINLHNQYPSLEIRLAPFGMHCTLYITDRVCFFDPYWFANADGRIEGRSFCIQAEPLSPTEQGFLTLARSHFDVLWNLAVDLETWHNRHRRRLSTVVPKIVRRRPR